MCSRLSHKRWIVYAKQPFAGPSQVLEYLGRYTHKVAISDYRILALEDGRVTFRYRDRKAGDTPKQITLLAEVFIGRFLFHILPRGLQKISFYGWMARNVRTDNLRRIRQALGALSSPPPPERMGRPDDPICPRCGKDHLRLTLTPAEQARAPPAAV